MWRSKGDGRVLAFVGAGRVDQTAILIAVSIRGAQYELIEGANHFAYIEDPEPFFSPINRFLEEHAR